ncbi:MAG: ABC transporter substrate-binding protein [Thiogranum sp.]|nr:ABC transporter substrate-binding protein [Thiogranum sp.]
MTNITRLLGLALCLACWAGCLTRAADSGAEHVIRQATEEIYEALDRQCAILEQQPEHLYALVDGILMLHADMERISRWVLGKYWRDADEEQRHEFIGQFRKLLVRTYATAVQLASLKDISYLPARDSARPDRATVRTEIKTPGSATLSVYYLLYETDQRWLVYDIQVDGVSLVNNYRTVFAEEIRDKGFPGMLRSLQEKNRQPMSAETAEQVRSRKSPACSSNNP